MDFIRQNQKILQENKQDFERVFEIGLIAFWDIFTGFDIVKFDDEFVKSPDGQSMEDVIQAEYGDEGVSIIQSLLTI